MAKFRLPQFTFIPQRPVNRPQTRYAGSSLYRTEQPRQLPWCLIAGGVEWLQGSAWKRVAENGYEVPDNAEVRLLDDSEARHVSRTGLKLEASLKQAGLSVTGLA